MVVGPIWLASTASHLRQGHRKCTGPWQGSCCAGTSVPETSLGVEGGTRRAAGGIILGGHYFGFYFTFKFYGTFSRFE